MGTRIDMMDGLKQEPKDLCSKYDGSYLLASIPSQKVTNEPVYIQTAGAGGHSGSYCVSFAPLKDFLSPDARKGRGVKYTEVPYSDFLVEEDRPNPCISNLRESTLMFSYNPERQWRRGVSEGNSFLYYPSTTTASFKKGRLSYDGALAVIFPQHTALPKALEELKEKKVVSRALSNKYWLIKTGTAISLFRRFAKMGSFQGNKFYANELSLELFRDELMTELPLLKEKYACSFGK